MRKHASTIVKMNPTIMNTNEAHVKWMQQALRLANQAGQCDEVPVGAILVKKGKKLGAATNANRATNDPTAHAEMLLLRKVSQTGLYYLHDTTLYVTLEPCLMCLGAIIQCQVQRVIFGAYDPKRGAAGSAVDILKLPSITWRLDIWGGVLSQQSSELLQNFFQAKRY